MLARADGEDDARAAAGADDHMLCPGGTVDEVPLPERPLLALDDEQGFAGKDEEVLLVRLPVVHRHRFTRAEHDDADTELWEVRLAVESQNRLPLPAVPTGRSGVEDEPPLAGCHQPVLGLSKRSLRDHLPIIESPGVVHAGSTRGPRGRAVER